MKYQIDFFHISYKTETVILPTTIDLFILIDIPHGIKQGESNNSPSSLSTLHIATRLILYLHPTDGDKQNHPRLADVQWNKI